MFYIIQLWDSSSLCEIVKCVIIFRFQNEAEKPAFDKSYIISHSDEESLMDAASTYSAAGSDRARGVVSTSPLQPRASKAAWQYTHHFVVTINNRTTTDIIVH